MSAEVKPFWILLEQEMMEWQWYQLDHMQIICTWLQTDNVYTPIHHHSVFTGQMPFLLPSQQCQMHQQELSSSWDGRPWPQKTWAEKRVPYSRRAGKQGY